MREKVFDIASMLGQLTTSGTYDGCREVWLNFENDKFKIKAYRRRCGSNNDSLSLLKEVQYKNKVVFREASGCYEKGRGNIFDSGEWEKEIDELHAQAKLVESKLTKKAKVYKWGLRWG